jgi:hypothetical protein
LSASQSEGTKSRRISRSVSMVGNFSHSFFNGINFSPTSYHIPHNRDFIIYPLDNLILLD